MKIWMQVIDICSWATHFGNSSFPFKSTLFVFSCSLDCVELFFLYFQILSPKMTEPLLLQQMVISNVEVCFYLLGYLCTTSFTFYAAYQATRRTGRSIKTFILKKSFCFFLFVRPRVRLERSLLVSHLKAMRWGRSVRNRVCALNLFRVYEWNALNLNFVA